MRGCAWWRIVCEGVRGSWVLLCRMTDGAVYGKVTELHFAFASAALLVHDDPFSIIFFCSNSSTNPSEISGHDMQMYSLSFRSSDVAIDSLSLYSISRRQSLHQIIATIHSLVLLLLGSLIKCSRNRINEPVKVGVAEICHRVSRWIEVCVHLDWWFNDAMFRALDCVVAPSCQQVSCVDHDRVFDGCCVYVCAHR
jgi:hypothetical protein